MKRRRSTHSRRSKDEMPEVNPTTDRADTNRRTSGYALSTRSAKTVDTERTDRTDKSDKTDRTDKSERDPKSRYMCESRSAAVKALYPNSPLAGQGSGGSSKNSVSSSKKKDRSSKELKREKSFPDNGTWDTTSIFTTDATDVQPPKKKDRSSKELKREKSIPDNGTWDTSSNLTSEATNTQLSTNDHAH
jgi:serine/arginine repetitive matrix protein 2